jgi:hypothetical protein
MTMPETPTPIEIREMSARVSSRRELFANTHDRHMLDDLLHMLRRLSMTGTPRNTADS